MILLLCGQFFQAVPDNDGLWRQTQGFAKVRVVFMADVSLPTLNGQAVSFLNRGSGFVESFLCPLYHCRKGILDMDLAEAMWTLPQL